MSEFLDKAAADAIAAIDIKANRLPSPGSKRRGSVHVNVCPKCDAACSTYPWTCAACGWSAASEPGLCPCQRVRATTQTKDGWEYPTDADYSDSPVLSPADKEAWAEAKEPTPIDVDPEPVKEITR